MRQKKYLGLCMALVLTVFLSACSMKPTKPEVKADQKMQTEVSTESKAEQKAETEAETEAMLLEQTENPSESCEYSGPDVVELVNLRGDETTGYKLADGTYMDRIDRVFIYNGSDIWTDTDGVEWNEVVR